MEDRHFFLQDHQIAKVDKYFHQLLQLLVRCFPLGEPKFLHIASINNDLYFANIDIQSGTTLILVLRKDISSIWLDMPSKYILLIPDVHLKH